MLFAPNTTGILTVLTPISIPLKKTESVFVDHLNQTTDKYVVFSGGDPAQHKLDRYASKYGLEYFEYASLSQLVEFPTSQAPTRRRHDPLEQTRHCRQNHNPRELCVQPSFSSHLKTHLVLVVDIGPCLQQFLNCLSMSLLGSYPQRNTTILMRDESCYVN